MTIPVKCDHIMAGEAHTTHMLWLGEKSHLELCDLCYIVIQASVMKGILTEAIQSWLNQPNTTVKGAVEVLFGKLPKQP